MTTKNNERMNPPGHHDYSSTHVNLPPEIAQKIIAFGKQIPDYELTEDGREHEPHVTVKYGIHSDDPSPVATAIGKDPPAEMRLGKTSLFKSSDHDVVKIDVHSPDLSRMNKKIEESGSFTDTHPGYHAHATIACVKPGEGDKYSGKSDFEGMRAISPSVTFSSKNGTKTEIPLKGTKMPKKMAYERKLARSARQSPPPDSGNFGSLPPTSIPHEAITDSPPPLATETMASGGLPIVRGNSNKAPLTPEGKQTVAATGSALAALGGPDQIVSSPAERTMETAAAVQAADPKQPPVTADPGLESHALGNLEGEAKTPAIKKFLADLVRRNPDYRIPGQGAMSSRQGESFNDARVRQLSAVRGVMQSLAQNPNQSIAVTKHSNVSKMIKAWIANGMPDDLSVDPKEFLKDETTKPGDVEKFAPKADGSWALDKFDPEKETSLPKGAIYLIEHGETPSTSTPPGQVAAAQKARAMIVSAIRDNDWKGARSAAIKASQAKLLSDQDIEEAIEEGLPNQDDAQSMPVDQLLAATSAAGPDRRAQMLPVLKQRLGDMSGTSPDAANRLKAHLGRLAVPMPNPASGPQQTPQSPA